MRLQQRGLDAGALRNAIASLEIIEAYPDDKYLPSFLLRGKTKGAVFHAQIATDVEGDNIRVVTMYAPDADEWDEGSRKRRTKCGAEFAEDNWNRESLICLLRLVILPS